MPCYYGMFNKVIKILLQRMNKKLCRSKKKSETKIEPCKSTLGENDKKKDRSQEPTVKESPASTRAHHEHNHMHHTNLGLALRDDHVIHADRDARLRGLGKAQCAKPVSKQKLMQQPTLLPLGD